MKLSFDVNEKVPHKWMLKKKEGFSTQKIGREIIHKVLLPYEKK